jgi:hypothetical protein
MPAKRNVPRTFWYKSVQPARRNRKQRRGTAREERRRAEQEGIIFTTLASHTHHNRSTRGHSTRGMGPAVSALAFPAPGLDEDFYLEGLLKRPDLVYLTTSRGEKIPAVHINRYMFWRAGVSGGGPLLCPRWYLLATRVGTHLIHSNGVRYMNGTGSRSIQYSTHMGMRRIWDSFFPTLTGSLRKRAATCWRTLGTTMTIASEPPVPRT